MNLSDTEKALLGVMLYLYFDKPYDDRRVVYPMLSKIECLPEAMQVNVRETLYHCRYNLNKAGAFRISLNGYDSASGIVSCTKKNNVSNFLNNALALPGTALEIHERGASYVVVYEVKVKKAYSLLHLRKHCMQYFGAKDLEFFKEFRQSLRISNTYTISYENLARALHGFCSGSRHCNMASRLREEKEYLVLEQNACLEMGTIYGSDNAIFEEFGCPNNY